MKNLNQIPPNVTDFAIKLEADISTSELETQITLTEEQQQIIDHNLNGKVCIDAKAGSGKTFTILQIVKKLMDGGMSPESTMLTTFSTKATNELEGRIAKLTTKYTASKIQIGTMHKFMLKYVSQMARQGLIDTKLYGKFIMNPPNSCTVKPWDSKKFIRQIFKDNNEKLTSDQMKATISLIGYFKNKGYHPFFDEYESQKDELNELALVKEYDKELSFHDLMYLYQGKLLEKGLIDFDDMICIALVGFKQNPEFVKSVSKTIKYLFIDELQDTNKIQYELFEMLSSWHKNVVGVGDQNQELYRFRATDSKYFNDFKSKAKVFPLTLTRRCPQLITEYSNYVIRNLDKVGMKCFKSGGKIETNISANPNEEAKYIVNKIKGFDENKTVKVLYRRNVDGSHVENELIKNDIQYEISGDKPFFQRNEVKLAMNYLNFLARLDKGSLSKILNKPYRGLSIIESNTIANKLKLRSTKINELLKGTKAQELIQMQEEFSKLSFENVGEMLSKAITLSRIKEYLEKQTYDDDVSGEVKLNTLNTLVSIASEYTNLVDFLKFVVRQSSKPQDPNSRIKLMTGHKAKGLEADLVIVCSLNESIFPSKKSPIEDETRLYYVAITRSKEELVLSCNLSNGIPSRFLNGYKEFLEEKNES